MHESLHTVSQPFGSVFFTIKADEREVLRSDLIRGTKLARFKFKVAGVNNFELIVALSGHNNND